MTTDRVALGLTLATVAVAAVGAYMLVERAQIGPRAVIVEPAPSPSADRDADDSPVHEASGALARELELEARLAELRAREAGLRAQLDRARLLGETREHFLERCATGFGGGCPLAHPPADVLEARARCGTIVWDGMPHFSTKSLEDYGISAREQELVERLAEAALREMEQAIVDNWRRATGEDPPAFDGPASLRGSPIIGVERGLRERFPEPSQDEVIVQLAKELAGQLPPPTRFEDRSPYYWHMSLRIGEGDRLEEAVAKELGAERARELRMAQNGWGGATSYSADLCEGVDEP